MSYYDCYPTQETDTDLVLQVNHSRPAEPQPSDKKPKNPCQDRSSAAQRRVSLQLSTSMHRQAKLLALEEDETLNSLIVRLLRNYLKERSNANIARQQRRRALYS